MFGQLSCVDLPPRVGLVIIAPYNSKWKIGLRIPNVFNTKDHKYPISSSLMIQQNYTFLIFSSHIAFLSFVSAVFLFC